MGPEDDAIITHLSYEISILQPCIGTQRPETPLSLRLYWNYHTFCRSLYSIKVQNFSKIDVTSIVLTIVSLGFAIPCSCLQTFYVWASKWRFKGKYIPDANCRQQMYNSNETIIIERWRSVRCTCYNPFFVI